MIQRSLINSTRARQKNDVKQGEVAGNIEIMMYNQEKSQADQGLRGQKFGEPMEGAEVDGAELDEGYVGRRGGSARDEPREV